MNNHDAHILTFTGNPLAETTSEYASWAAGRTQRATSSSFQMGGKGINVSKMLLRLGARTTALSFLGGHSGAQCAEWLGAQGLHHAAASTRQATRSGLVVRSPGTRETTFLGADVIPEAEAWAEMTRILHSMMPGQSSAKHALAFCGSCPGWASEAAACLRSMIQAWIEGGHPLFVDTYGPPLAWFTRLPVSLVKINADELRTLVPRQADINELLEQLQEESPVHTWIVSDGPGPVWLATKGEKPCSLTPPAVEEISATGSGDVLLAALLHARLCQGADWRQALAFALPLASANAAHPGIAEFPLPQGWQR